MRQVLRNNKEVAILCAAIVVSLIFAVAMMTISDFLTNVGFLVVGALLAVLTTLLSEKMGRKTKARDLARALHIELADRVARCCFDAEAPWQAYLTDGSCAPGEMSVVRLRKFVPDPPIIFRASAQQIALLGSDAPQALIRFYFRLAAWERDLNNIAAEWEEVAGGVPPKRVHFLARRLKQTLAPGLSALKALAPWTENDESVETASIRSYDETRETKAPEGSLRERLGRLI